MITLSSFFEMSKTFSRQLWLSVSSADFYREVYKHYKGYGLRYLFTATFIAVVIYSIFLLNHIINLKDYFLKGQINSRNINIEYIFKQLPIIFYNEGSISIEEETPFYLYDSQENKLAVIDHENTLSYKERVKIPIILSKDKIIFSLSNHHHFAIEYNKLFGAGDKVLTIDIIKKQCGEIMAVMQKFFIYLGVPLLVLMNLFSNIVENIFIVLLIYFSCRIYNIEISLKASFRLAMFASGAIIILHFLVAAILPLLNKYLWIISLWPKYLLFTGITRENKRAI